MELTSFEPKKCGKFENILLDKIGKSLKQIRQHQYTELKMCTWMHNSSVTLMYKKTIEFCSEF